MKKSNSNVFAFSRSAHKVRSVATAVTAPPTRTLRCKHVTFLHVTKELPTQRRITPVEKCQQYTGWKEKQEQTHWRTVPQETCRNSCVVLTQEPTSRVGDVTQYWSHGLFSLLNPTGHVMHHQFNIQQLYALPTLYLCVLYLSENKQRLVPLTA